MSGFYARYLQEAIEQGNVRRIGVVAQQILEDGESNEDEVRLAFVGLSLMAPDGSAQAKAYRSAAEGRGNDSEIRYVLCNQCGSVGRQAEARLSTLRPNRTSADSSSKPGGPSSATSVKEAPTPRVEEAKVRCECCEAYIEKAAIRRLCEPGTNWTGVLQRFLKVGVCSRCYEDYGVTFGLVVPWKDGDWKSHHRRNLALVESSAAAAQLLEKVPANFEDILLFGHRRILQLLTSERDSKEKTAVSLADNWSRFLEKDDWKKLTSARQVLQKALVERRSTVSAARSDGAAVQMLGIAETKAGIDKLRSNVANLEAVQLLLDTSPIGALSKEASGLAARVGELATEIERVAKCCERPAAYARAEECRTAAQKLLTECQAIAWNVVEAPGHDGEPMAGLAGRVLATQREHVARAMNLAASAAAHVKRACDVLLEATVRGQERRNQLDNELAETDSLLVRERQRVNEERRQDSLLAGVGGGIGIVVAGLVAAAFWSGGKSDLWIGGIPVTLLGASILWVWWHARQRQRKKQTFEREETEVAVRRATLSLEQEDVAKKLARLANDSEAMDRERIRR